MPQICTRCTRANPAEAIYCWHDGGALGPGSIHSAPINMGAQPFPQPFLFPNGVSCGNFDQLALACQENWSLACGLIREAPLQMFLAGVGRGDLVKQLHQFINDADPDRSLDHFLEALPTEILTAPRLAVERLEIDLGVIPLGRNKSFPIHLMNRGMRLIIGNISCDSSSWLSLSEVPGVQERVLQFHREATIIATVQGKALRASPRPLETRLVIDGSGGRTEILVRVTVPVKPFAHGILAGARSPREIGEKAQVNPREAARYFDNRSVADWYDENGWTYPIQGPVANGLGGLQQFFEAVGLSTPPRVDVGTAIVNLEGEVGDRLEYSLPLCGKEKRAVFALASSDKPWLTIGPIQGDGRIATVPLLVAEVPHAPGTTLLARVNILTNGGQRFIVPVTLKVGTATPVAKQETSISAPVTKAEPPPIPNAAIPSSYLLSIPSLNLRDLERATPGQELLSIPGFQLPDERPTLEKERPPERPTLDKEQPPAPPKPPRTPAASKLHYLPGLLLIVVILAILLRDAAMPDKVSPPEVPVEEEVGRVQTDAAPLLELNFSPNDQFGLVLKGEEKRLTHTKDGETNQTLLRIGHDQDNVGRVFLFGGGAHQRQGSPSVRRFLDDIEVTQFVEIVPGDQPVKYADGVLRRQRNTCLIRYTIENKGMKSHPVGLRVLLDTWIGASDGLPFTANGASIDPTAFKHYTEQTLPDFLQVLERPGLQDPGVVAQLTLRLGKRLEPPSQVSLTHSTRELSWNVELAPIKTDSAVVLYWKDRALNPGEKREVGFAYGLGNVSSDPEGKIGVTLGRGVYEPEETFSVTAYVSAPQPDEKAKLVVPDGFRIEKEAERSVPASGMAQRASAVTWRVRAPADEGTFELTVERKGVSQSKRVLIAKPRPREKDPGLFR